MKRITVAALLAGCFLSGSSNAASANIDGQVFVVTKGQQTIKLALVSVVAVSEKNLMSSIDAKTSTIIANRKELAEKIEKKKVDVIALKSNVKYVDGLEGSPFTEIEKLQAVCTLDAGIDEFMKCAKSPEGKPAIARLHELNSQYKDAMESVNSVRRELKALMKEHRALTSLLRSVINTDNLSGGYIDRTKTDADGKFSLSVPQGQRVAILADSTRAVIDSTESYQWIVWFTPKKGARNSLFLANDNLLETHCESCVQIVDMRTYPDVSRYSEYISVR